MKTLRFSILVGAVVLGLTSRLQAVPTTINWNSGFANAGVLPDGNTTGWFDTRTVSGITGNSILDVNVFLDITGGWNGDYYAYLTHSSGFSVLLNRVGQTGGNPFGYGDAGLNVTLDDSAANGDIHLYQLTLDPLGGALTGTWRPDGSSFSSFNGLDPNGSWTLFVADLSNGEVGTVANWGLRIDAETGTVGVPDAGSTLTLLSMAFAALMWSARRRVTV